MFMTVRNYFVSLNGAYHLSLLTFTMKKRLRISHFWHVQYRLLDVGIGREDQDQSTVRKKKERKKSGLE